MSFLDDIREKLRVPTEDAGNYLRDMDLKRFLIPAAVGAGIGGVALPYLSDKAYEGDPEDNSTRRRLRKAVIGAGLGAAALGSLPLGMSLLSSPHPGAIRRRGLVGSGIDGITGAAMNNIGGIAGGGAGIYLANTIRRRGQAQAIARLAAAEELGVVGLDKARASARLSKNMGGASKIIDDAVSQTIWDDALPSAQLEELKSNYNKGKIHRDVANASRVSGGVHAKLNSGADVTKFIDRAIHNPGERALLHTMLKRFGPGVDGRVSESLAKNIGRYEKFTGGRLAGRLGLLGLAGGGAYLGNNILNSISGQ